MSCLNCQVGWVKDSPGQECESTDTGADSDTCVLGTPRREERWRPAVRGVVEGSGKEGVKGRGVGCGTCNCGCGNCGVGICTDVWAAPLCALCMYIPWPVGSLLFHRPLRAGDPGEVAGGGDSRLPDTRTSPPLVVESNRCAGRGRAAAAVAASSAACARWGSLSGMFAFVLAPARS